MPQQQVKSAFLNPYVVVGEFEIRPGMSVADFGSGAGHFTFAMAREVGSGGVVHAIDVRPTVLEALKGHAELDGLFHVTIHQRNLEQKAGSHLSEASQDRVLCSNILHQVNDRAAIFREARRVLKPAGKLIVIDWDGEAPFGPGRKILPEAVKTLAQAAGFVLERQFNTGAYHYGFMFKIKN